MRAVMRISLRNRLGLTNLRPDGTGARDAMTRRLCWSFRLRDARARVSVAGASRRAQDLVK